MRPLALLYLLHPDMTPDQQNVINELLDALAKVNAFAKAVTNSSEITAIEAVFPGVGQIVSIIKEIEGGVDIVTTAAPLAEAVLPLLSLLEFHFEFKPADGDELAHLSDRFDG